MRSGRPLSLHLDGTPYSLFPQGVDGTGEPALSDEATTCLAEVNVAGVLSDIASCSDDSNGSDDRPTRRRNLWIVAPAVLAAAAALVGAIVLTRPQQDAVVPADTTLVPAPPSSVVPAPTSTVAVVELGFGVSLRTSNENFDGDGGACLTLSTPTDSTSGCANGPTRRSARALALRLDGTPYAFFPRRRGRNRRADVAWR